MKKIGIVLPLLALLSACGSAPTPPENTASSAPQAIASNTAPKITKPVIPEAEPSTVVQVQRASLRTTTNHQAPIRTDITSVVFSRSSNRRTPDTQWMQKELRLDHNLTVTLTVYNKQGKIISTKKGKISEQEYLSLVGALKGARYQTLNPIARPKFLAGHVTDLLTVSTASNFRQFRADERQQFPTVIQTLFTRYTSGR